MSPILAHYQEKILENMIAEYQYILKMPVETKTVGADKYSLQTGDTITLKEKYDEKEYSFKVEGIYDYPSALSVFMPIEDFREVFEKEEDLTKVSRQLDVSMGNMFILFHIFAAALSALLLYLLTKLIIEKNTTSISMVKILGYDNKEISSLYLTATTWVVVVSILFSLVISTKVLEIIWRAIMATFTGYLAFYVEPGIYPKMFLMGMAVYLLIAFVQFERIKKIPMEEALKNVE